jgi:plasmid stabilization system protein ParE
VAARTRQVVWAESGQAALDAVLADIFKDSPDGAARVLARALDVAGSLATLADRGRVVPEVDDVTLRELFVYRYRLLYRVRDDRVVIVAFLHGARDFEKWRRELAPDL